MPKEPYPSQIQERFMVRLPDGMRDRIAEAAKANNRSMNAEIVARLEASFEFPMLSPADQEKMMALFDHMLARALESGTIAAKLDPSGKPTK